MSRFALTDDEAQRRYEKFKSLDPFPEIPPALLNSADIEDYVAETGMLFPFDTSNEKLKSASYEVNILGDVIIFDRDGEQQKKTLKQGTPFKLSPNSIAFVSIEPNIRLPDYIALRFNLKIRHVHRGLLLGTGPLVDPGFQGRLLVPLHNLTTTEYDFRGGDALIWFEFTKVSPHEKWSWNDGGRPFGRSGELRGFPKRKIDFTPEKYLQTAADGLPIRSSISEALEIATQAARRAEEQVRRLREIVTIGGIIAVVALLLTIAFGVIPIYSLVEESNSFITGTARDNLTDFRNTQHKFEDGLKALETRVGAVEKKVASPNATPETTPAPRENPRAHTR
jgi:deoxycytidine triphosphate deaminase